MELPKILISRAEYIATENWDDYAAGVSAAGGDPVEFTLSEFQRDNIIPDSAGIVLTAGVDINPGRYNSTPHEKVSEWNDDRDIFEIALIERAILDKKPLLCICRGAQLLNVWAGGGLLQHLENREPHRARRNPTTEIVESGWHDVTVTPNSLLATITGTSVLHVNSRHHQAITKDNLAPDVKIAAIAEDGVVEAIELSVPSWVLGIQWHPEQQEMLSVPNLEAGSKAIWSSFIQAATSGGLTHL